MRLVLAVGRASRPCMGGPQGNLGAFLFSSCTTQVDRDTITTYGMRWNPVTQRRHGRRRHVAAWCSCTFKMCFTTFNAAMSAVTRVPGAVRAYRGNCCGHWHITSYTADDFAQVMADRSVQAGVECGIVTTTNDERTGDEARTEPHPWDRTQDPRATPGGPGAEQVERGCAPPGPEASPAGIARFLAERGRKGQSR